MMAKKTTLFHLRNEKNERQKEKIGKLSDKKKIELIKTFSPDKIQTTVWNLFISKCKVNFKKEKNKNSYKYY